MPKWGIHREVAQILNIKLPEYLMREIDSEIDGFKKRFTHDFWRSDVETFNMYLNEVRMRYGEEAVKYALLHVFLDLATDFIVREESKDEGDPTIRGLKNFVKIVKEVAKRYPLPPSMNIEINSCDEYINEALERVSLMLSDKHIKHIWEELSNEIKRSCRFLNSLLYELDEVKKRITNAMWFSLLSKCVSKTVKLYGKIYNLSFYEKDILRKLLFKLWSKKTRRTSSVEMLLKNIKQELSRGLQKENVEKLLRILKEILIKYPEPLLYCRQIVDLF